MAAILCKGIGSACSSLSELLCLPCKACGMGCEAFGQILKSPFLPYMGLTFGLNVPCIVFGAKALVASNSCPSIAKWFLLNIILCAGHCVACLYIVHKIRYEPWFGNPPPPKNSVVASTVPASVFSSTTTSKGGTDEKASAKSGIFSSITGKGKEDQVESGTYYATATVMAQPMQEEEGTAANSMARIKNVLCNDPGVAVYIVVGLVWVVWQSIGFGRSLGLDGSNCGGQDVANWFATSLTCGFLYMSLVGIGFVCSLCCLR